MYIITTNVWRNYKESLTKGFGCDGFVFACKNYNDTKPVYNVLADFLKMELPVMDLIALHYLNGKNIKTLLQDAKKYEIISDYKIEKIN